MDSGSLMVGDPCYLPGFEFNESTGKEPVLDTVTNKLYQYVYTLEQLVEGAEIMENYESIVPGTHMTFNQAIASGRMVTLPHKPDTSYSRSGCHWATCSSKEGYAQIGDCAEAIVFSSGYGDGVYEVWGRRNKEGRIIEVRVLMG